jgi:transketolase
VQARAAGVTTILYYYPFECFQEGLAPLVDLLITGQPGLAAFSGKPVEHLESASAAAHALAGLGFRRAAVTLGPHGALVVDGDSMEVVPTCSVVARNLSLGADAFSGAFAVRLGEGAGLRDAAAFANAAASLSIPQLVIGDGLPERARVEERARELLLGKRLPLDRTLSGLHEHADRIRALILQMLADAGSGHPGGSLSAAEILAVLYFHVMRVDPQAPGWAARDRFVLSKGHAAPVLYATLALRGFFPVGELSSLRRLGARLQGHPDRLLTPGVDVSTGSLGQGLSVACGLALAARVLGADWRTFVLLGDGELEEGEVWEAAMSAAGYSLDNLVAIVDYNGLQIDGSVSRIKGSLEPLADKWRAFGWRVEVVGGHDIAQLVRVLDEKAPGRDSRPTMVIAHTIKGKGVSFMERIVDYHGNRVSPEDCARALAELDGGG